MTGLSMALMPSSEPIAGSSAFRYGCTPQVSFHLHFFKTALTHFLQAEDAFALSNAFLDFQGMGPSSEPIASSSAFGYGRVPQVLFLHHFLQTALTHFYRLRMLLPLRMHSWIFKVWDSQLSVINCQLMNGR